MSEKVVSLQNVRVSEENIARFIQGYLGCVLWAETDNSSEDGGDPLDANYEVSDFAESAMQEAQGDCRDFIEANRADLLRYVDKVGSQDPWFSAGFDFWLTRTGHGTGYWDRGNDKVFTRLTAASKPYGSVDAYVGDDKQIYFQ